jgi:hypothetical protein
MWSSTAVAGEDAIATNGRTRIARRWPEPGGDPSAQRRPEIWFGGLEALDCRVGSVTPSPQSPSRAGGGSRGTRSTIIASAAMAAQPAVRPILDQAKAESSRPRSVSPLNSELRCRDTSTQVDCSSAIRSHRGHWQSVVWCRLSIPARWSTESRSTG